MANPTVTYARSGAADAQEAFKANTVGNGGAIDTSCSVDFSKCSLFKCTMSNVTVELTPTNLPLGQTVRLNVSSGTTAPTVTWGTMTPAINWTGTQAPAFSAGKITMVTLLNDGAATLGAYTIES